MHLQMVCKLNVFYLHYTPTRTDVNRTTAGTLLPHQLLHCTIKTKSELLAISECRIHFIHRYCNTNLETRIYGS